MLRKSLQLWPPAMATEEAAPALSHWTAAKPGATPSLWPASPQWLNRYVDELLNAQTLSVFGAQSAMTRAARELRKRFMP